MVQDGEVVSMSGKRVKVRADTLCVHGDEATGVIVGRGIRQALEAADISVVPLTDMKLYLRTAACRWATAVRSQKY